MKQLKTGFTLIELLVVIAIIAILATLILTNIQGVRERARDLRRKSDLSSIQKSLRLYFNDYRIFPTSSANFAINGCGASHVATCSWGGSFATSTTTYMQRLPLDPSSTTTNPITYQYYRSTTDSDQYIIVAKLENRSDPEKTESQARCSAIYNSFTGNKDVTKDYVICAE
mgnify:CR=1 FL=1